MIIFLTYIGGQKWGGICAVENKNKTKLNDNVSPHKRPRLHLSVVISFLLYYIIMLQYLTSSINLCVIKSIPIKNI